MKHFATTLLAAIGFSAAVGATAGAANLSAKAPVYKAHPRAAAPVYSWTGCYIGGHAGGGWSGARWTNIETTAPWADFQTPGEGISYHASGRTGGGQIGCNYQFDRQWVLGIEGTFSGAGIKGSRLDTTFGSRDDIYATKVTALYSITGRLGYAWNNWLFYGKGGFAAARTNWAAVNTTPVSLGFPDMILPIPAAGHAKLWHQGGLIGAGIEYAVSPNFILGVEYNFIALNSKTGQFGDAVGPYIGSYINDVNPGHIQSVVGRISYKFDAPIGAR
jgi:outer membrane immunogenic protein